MLLENKNAVIYGAGGAVGGAVARVFAREGANVFLAGRTMATLQAVVAEICAAGGAAEAAEVDAVDEYAVESHLEPRPSGRDGSMSRSTPFASTRPKARRWSTSAARLPGPLLGGFGVACAAVEALSRNLAGELGPRGIRVVCLRPDRLPETATDPEAARAGRAPSTLLGRLPTLADVANTAAFMASDHANAMTATVANLTCGSTPD